MNHICKCTCIVGYNFKMNFLLYVMVQKLDHVLLESKAIYSWAFLKWKHSASHPYLKFNYIHLVK